MEVVVKPVEIEIYKPCEHPENAIHFYRDYPAKNYPDRRLVTNFHCHACGYQGNLWRTYHLPEKEAAYHFDLMETSFWETMDFELECVNRGLMSYYFWEDYEKDKDTDDFKAILRWHLEGLFSILNAERMKAFHEWAFKDKLK